MAIHLLKSMGFLLSLLTMVVNPCWVTNKTILELENSQPTGSSCVVDSFQISSHLLQLGQELVIHASASCQTGQPFLRLTANGEVVAEQSTTSWWYSLIASDYAPLGEVSLCVTVLEQDIFKLDKTDEVCKHISIVDNNYG